MTLLTASSFSPHLHTYFRVEAVQSLAIQLELIEVRERTSSPGQVQFTILFCGSTEWELPQGLYDLAHDRMGLLENLFLVPVAKTANGYLYEAVFNLLVLQEA